MIYNNFQDIKLSSLGMGCMRFPVLEKDDSKIDMDKTREMIAYSIENGINYFDTAWIYHGGNSETVMGEILKDYPRDSFYLATKFPGFDLKFINQVEEIFEAQLKKCQVEYFDFYLFHNLCEINVEQYLDPELGIYDYLMKQKKNGRIRHLGFSTHGTLETVKRFLDAYGKDMEFCQIQLNWLDWDFQDAKAKVELLNEYNIPIWVMEPVRGGSLAKLPPEYEERLRKFRPDATPSQWAFRFLQSIENVTVTLSGMSNFDQLKENIRTFSESKPLSKAELDTLFDIAREMTSRNELPCTACGYCKKNCPMNLEIPDLIKLYNKHICSGGGTIPAWAMQNIPDDKKPSACIGCKACDALCPQNIKISEMMADFAKWE